ncbi:sporulation protein YqfD [Paenibacillus sp. F411]|uniref:Sporulation protein YqfD n=1 Tax=Paenibacillus algicola TaxID=2565926 RepID=A0A4V1G3S2_9BACL|nr:MULTISPECIES: sporulation protein YqfD [Paenibacillus]MBO2943257.1 sporulation protein YqfD [Paenibacillus sp. F411]QCT02184.1 sporulation protein YqfD [Paenibacillus algicola]
MNIPTMIQIRGYLKVSVRGEQLSAFINAITEAGIPVWEMKPTGSASASFKLLLSDFKELRPILKGTGCRTRILERHGLPFRAARLLRRKIFAAGIVVFFALLLLMSSMVWSIRVEGNEKVATEDVLQAAKQEGLYTYQWIFRLKSMDKLSASLAAQLPGTSWVGVERDGTSITIQVVEASVPKKSPLQSPRHLVSTADAVVTSIYAEKGLPQVAVNSRVKKGDILISGLLGDEENQQQVVAKGEVKGLVWHEYEIEVPLEKKSHVLTGEFKKRSYLVLGNRAVQLWGYGEMPFEASRVLTLYDPLTWRNHPLPLGWMTEKEMEVSQNTETVTEQEAKKEGLASAFRDILAKYGPDSRLVSQKILHDQKENGKVYMKVLFEVEEVIAKELPIVYNQGD